jgi:hypothetical protein
VFPAKAKSIIQARDPIAIVPGKGSFISPRIVTAIDSPFVAGAPEIVTLKDFYIKENNPGAFSSINSYAGIKTAMKFLLCARISEEIFGSVHGGVG